VILTGDAGSWRDVRYGDEADVLTIFGGWDADRKRMTARRAVEGVHKWVNDMTVQPTEVPATPDSHYRAAMIAHEAGTGDPVALVAWVIRGANNPKNWPISATICFVELFSVAPNKRANGVGSRLMNLLTVSLWRDTQPDLIVYQYLPEVAEMQARREARTWQSVRTVQTLKGERVEVVGNKADHDARMLAAPGDNEASVFNPRG